MLYPERRKKFTLVFRSRFAEKAYSGKNCRLKHVLKESARG